MCDFSDGGRLRIRLIIYQQQQHQLEKPEAPSWAAPASRSGQVVQSVRAGGTVWQGRRYSLAGQAVQSVRAGGTVCQGRRYSLAGQAVQSVRAGGTVCQGRRYSLLGQAVQSVRAGGTVCQGRRHCLSGQAVQSVRAGGTVCQGRRYKRSGQAVQSVRAGSTEHPSQYKLHLPGHSAPAYLGRTPFWAISLRPSASVFQTIQHSITCCLSWSQPPYKHTHTHIHCCSSLTVYPCSNIYRRQYFLAS